MKTITTTILLIFFIGQGIAANLYYNKKAPVSISVNDRTINPIDTIVFDLSAATLTSTYIDIPVSILSDDTVNALDFSLKYNETKLTYDSIINTNPDLSALAYFNTGDRFLRLTSNSFERMANNTSLLKVRFLISSASVSVSAADFDSITVYLNGDPCSYKIKGTAISTVSISEIKNNNVVTVYPNPATTTLNLIASENVTAELMDVNGKQVFLHTTLAANTKKEINTETISNGVYLLKMYNKDFVSVKRVVINK